MFKISKSVAGFAAAATLLLAACSGGGAAAPSGSTPAGGDGGKLSVVNVVNGPLGDASFFDDAQSGIDQLKASGHATETIQSEANNPAQWKSNLESVSGKWGIVVVGSTQITEILEQVAPKYPDQKYLLYDDELAEPNVASIKFKQNEGSYLAGALAALVVTNPDKFPLAKGGQKTIGLVAGMDIPVIQDFVVGYKAGAAAVDPNVEVKVSFIGNFSDAQKGYDQAKTMYDQGADVVFQVASAAGLGVLKAAAESDRYVIGVDSNQNEVQKGHVLASMLKNIGEGINTAITAADEGKLAFGEVTAYGIANDGVGLTFENNGDLVPADIQAKVEEYSKQVADGQVTVPTAFN